MAVRPKAISLDPSATAERAWIDQARIDHAQIDHAQIDHAQIDHAQIDHAQIDHAQIDHAQIDHAQIDHAWVDRPPRFAEDVSFFLLEDQGLIFCEGTQSLYSSNTLATYIWLEVEAGQGLSAIAESLAASFNFTLDQAREFLVDTLERWQGLHLLAGQEADRAPLERFYPDQHRPQPLPLDVGHSLPDPVVTRSYAFLGRRFALEFGNQTLADLVHPALAHLAVQEEAPTTQVTSLAVHSWDEGFLFILDDRPVGQCQDARQVLPLVHSLLFLESFYQDDHALSVHAGAVTRNGRCLLLPAEGGSGKTSLTAALLTQGFGYISDDVMMLERETLRARGLSMALSIKPGGETPLAALYPDLPDQPLHLRPDGREVRYLTPPLGAFDPGAGNPGPGSPGAGSPGAGSPGAGSPGAGSPGVGSLPVAWLVFPKYQPDRATALKPLSKPAALQRLLALAAQPRRLDLENVTRLADWVSELKCFELSVSDLGEASRLLQAMTDS